MKTVPASDWLADPRAVLETAGLEPVMLLHGDQRFVLAREQDGFESNPGLERELARSLDGQPYPLTEEVLARIRQRLPARA